jgi:putative transposase
VFDRTQRWYFYKARYRYRMPVIMRPELAEVIRNIIKERPVTYGYRRVHAMIRNLGIKCDPKTVHRYMRLKLWLSTERTKRKVRERREGVVSVAEPNKRWASDITNIKAWNGEKGRLAIVIDADRQVMEYRWARSIKGEDIRDLVKNALLKRFDNGVIQKKGSIEFLSDNGPEYIKTELRWFLKCAGFEVCNTPIRSPESNGIAESFFKSFKRDYVYQNVLESFEDIGVKIGGWIDDYNTKAPHSALKMMSPSKFYENWKVKK